MHVLAYHITWGTYGTRLHGDPRKTVDRQQNQFGTPVLGYDEHRWEQETALLKFPPIRFTHEQMLVVESIVPQVCDRGYWKYHACAAGPDHVHVILSSQHDPQTIRRLLKRWIGQELSKQYALPEGATWWAECGSVRWIDEPKYYKNAMEYVTRQSAKTGPRTARLNLEA